MEKKIVERIERTQLEWSYIKPRIKTVFDVWLNVLNNGERESGLHICLYDTIDSNCRESSYLIKIERMLYETDSGFAGLKVCGEFPKFDLLKILMKWGEEKSKRITSEEGVIKVKDLENDLIDFFESDRREGKLLQNKLVSQKVAKAIIIFEEDHEQ